MDFVEVIKWIGAPATVLAAISLLAYRSERFQALSSAVKTWVFFGLCFGLPLTTWAVLKFTPPAWYATAGEILGVLGACAALYVSTQGVHWLDKTVDALVELLRAMQFERMMFWVDDDEDEDYDEEPAPEDEPAPDDGPA